MIFRYPLNLYLKQSFILLIFLLITPLTLTISSLALININRQNQLDLKVSDNQGPSLIHNPQSGVLVFASLPSELPIIKGTIIEADARIEIIRQYLEKYDSPLKDFAEVIVNSADKNGFDYRLTTAIAQQESNLCKNIPFESYNCWGWGIHSQGTLGFNSYPEGIITVSEGIKENYIEKGLVTIEDIMSKYTPLSPGSWAFGVTSFMQELQ